MKIKRRLAAVVIALTFVFAAASVSFATTDQENIVRIAGMNRFETSAIISLFTFEDDEADAIVLVNGTDFPDALSAAPFACSVGAPILMVNGPEGIFAPTVAEEIDRIDSDHDANVYIIGGTGAVDDEVIKQLKSAGYENIERIAGINRYETAVNVAKNIRGKKIAFIANGMNYPDALGAGSAASLYNGVILFTATDKLNEDTKEYLEHIAFDSVVILGGTGAVSPEVEAELKSLQDDVTRVDGLNRYETCLALAKICFPETEAAVVATGMDFADALAGGPFAAYNGAPILLINPYADTVDQSIKDYIRSSGVKQIAVLGGTGAISDKLYDDLAQLVK